MKIKEVKGEIKEDSASGLAIQAVCQLTDGRQFFSSVGSGLSRGKAEKKPDQPAVAVKKISQQVSPLLKDKSITDQKKIDDILVQLSQKSGLGVNTSLAVSQAVAQAGAAIKKRPVWRYLGQTYDLAIPKKIPQSLVVVAEGGRHVPQLTGLKIQEFLIGGDLKIASQVYQELYQYCHINRIDCLAGAEGGLGPKIYDDGLILEIISQLKSRIKFLFGLDIAAESDPSLNPDFSFGLASQFPLDLIEDPFKPSQISQWQKFYKVYQNQLLIVGDDLTVTDSVRIEQAAKEKLINGVVIKPNQAGTVSQTFRAVKVAHKNQLKIIVSHRAQETDDEILADISVAAAADFLKAGYPTQLERKVKYERLAKIGRELKKPASSALR